MKMDRGGAGQAQHWLSGHCRKMCWDKKEEGKEGEKEEEKEV